MTTPDSPEGLTVEELARLKEITEALGAKANMLGLAGVDEHDARSAILALIAQVERLTAERDEALRISALKTQSHAAAFEDADTLAAENERLLSLINTPRTDDWVSAVALEAAHQQERWGSAHDVGKTAFDWFWLLGYLGQKAADAQVRGDVEKAKHHTISTSAALLNWHRALTGESTTMRPGIEPSAALAAGEPAR